MKSNAYMRKQKLEYILNITSQNVPSLYQAIVSGAWSQDKILALGSEDCTITLSNTSGDTMEHTQVKTCAVAIQFATQKTDGEAEDRLAKQDKLAETTVSLNLGGEAIMLYNLKGEEEPIELKFQPKYGRIVTYKWFGDGYMILGFSNGYVVIISTHMKEIGEELFSWRFFEEKLLDICFCPSLDRAAAVGDDSLKIIEHTDNVWRQVKSESVRFDRHREGQVTNVAWTSDGQILTVGTMTGRVYSFVAAMPMVHDSYGSRMAYMSSLQEVSVMHVHKRSLPGNIEIEIEPSFIALGPTHMAVGMNNRVWYYNCSPNSGRYDLNKEKEYLSTVEQVVLGYNCAAVLCNGQVYLHMIDQPAASVGDAGNPKIFPEKNDTAICLAMTSEFLIFGTANGVIEFFSLSDWRILTGCEKRHDFGIQKLFPRQGGTRVIYQDTNGNGFLYNPVDSSITAITDITSDTQNVMWDSADPGVFVTFTKKKELETFIYAPLTIVGPTITKLGPVTIDKNGDIALALQATSTPDTFTPVLVRNGIVTGQLKNGTVERVTLLTHSHIETRTREKSKTVIKKCFAQNLILLRLKNAWEIASKLRDRANWLALSGKAMEVLDVDLACRVYRELGDPGMVMALNSISHVEDKNLLAGFISMMFDEYQQAEDLFLRSSKPITALEMRRDLLQWDHTMKLAKALAPDQLPEVSIRYGQQLEFRGDYSRALELYQGASSSGSRPLTPIEQKDVTAGVSRTYIRLNEVRRGREMALESGDKRLCVECATILENMKQFADAAVLYERGQKYEKAAGIYIDPLKDFKKAAPLMDKIYTPKLHSLYAKAKEKSKEYKDAAQAYERAGDNDSVVRLYLQHLNQPFKAIDIVRKTHSAKAAQNVAQYCKQKNNHAGAIEFLLMAKRSDEAFDIATKFDNMAQFVAVLGETGRPEQYMRIARYYENKQDWANAAKFFGICGAYHKALKYYLVVGEDDTALRAAIDIVGKARSDILTHTLIDYLMGETDSNPKDPNYIFRLYMALGNYPQAAKTAIIIARQERELGNYATAHRILFETHRDLQEQNINVPRDLRRALMILHSYIIVKKLYKLGDHETAARLLLRVCKNINKFPSHVVQLYTSAVMECMRAKLKWSGYQMALKLMHPDHRAKVDKKFKRKIEKMIRKRPKSDNDPKEALSPCPHCMTPVAASALECTNCKNVIPYCIISGLHMTPTDYSYCYHCNFPARHSVLMKYLDVFDSCPMCSATLEKDKIQLLRDPTEHLKRQLQLHLQDENNEMQKDDKKDDEDIS